MVCQLASFRACDIMTKCERSIRAGLNAAALQKAFVNSCKLVPVRRRRQLDDRLPAFPACLGNLCIAG